MRGKHSFLSTFGFAFTGIWQAIKEERNIKIHLFLALLAIVLGIVLGISKSDWLVLILIIFLVLAAEIFNSAIEEICDLLKEKLNLDYQATRNIRNISAGAVLVLAIGSVILGLIIFLPHICQCFIRPLR